MTPATTVGPVPLDPTMRRRLERHGAKVTDATTERDQVILEAHAAGGSLREIGAAVGLSHQSVKNIIERAGAQP